jgi:hypothetical protein
MTEEKTQENKLLSPYNNSINIKAGILNHARRRPLWHRRVPSWAYFLFLKSVMLSISVTYSKPFFIICVASANVFTVQMWSSSWKFMEHCGKTLGRKLGLRENHQSEGAQEVMQKVGLSILFAADKRNVVFYPLFYAQFSKVVFGHYAFPIVPEDMCSCG